MDNRKPRQAARLDNLKVWLNPATKTIYAGYATGASAKQKVDITTRAVEATAIYLQHNGGELEFEDGSRLVRLPPGSRSPLYCDCVDPLRLLTPGGETICDNCGKYLPKN
jgi:hypothetical protein